MMEEMRQQDPGVVRVGTAGWTIPARYADHFAGAGTHLERYARKLDAAEINSSFHRPHRDKTYARWAASVPEHFRFAVKLPKTVTHERKLVDCSDLLGRFGDEVAGLGEKRAVLLVQLPPRLAFDRPVATAFFADLRRRFGKGLACEPRHPSWFAPQAEALLLEHRVARVSADPPIPDAPGAGEPAGFAGLVYLRLHGSPKVYHSDYDAETLARIARRLERWRAAGAEVWCIFDNTAAGCALGNALAVDAVIASEAKQSSRDE